MLIRRETPADVAAVQELTGAAFTGVAYSAPPVEPGGPPGEVTLLEWLRADSGWIPALSLVALGGDTGASGDGEVVGHVVCTRGFVDEAPAVGLGPISVAPARQKRGVGSALMHAVLGAADALDEPLVVLLGDPGYYGRFGFRAATEFGIEAPDPAWGALFQARPLAAYDPAIRGTFRYAPPFAAF